MPHTKKIVQEEQRTAEIIAFPSNQIMGDKEYLNSVREIFNLPPCHKTKACLTSGQRNSINWNCPHFEECKNVRILLLK